MDHVQIDGWFCIAKDAGNIKQWATIEVMTFYLNIAVMIFYLVCARLLPEKQKPEDPNASINKSVNESLMSEDAATIRNLTEENAIQEELNKISSSSDLLRSVEDERQYNKLQLLLFSICAGCLIFQKTELTIAHNDVMPAEIPKFGTEAMMYDMYEHQIKT